MDGSPSTIADLATSWQPIHEELLAADSHPAIRLRMHRGLSWMKRAGGFAQPQDADGRLIYAWIALNALYAQWRPREEGPPQERQVRRDFLIDIVQRDKADRIQSYLKANRAT
jgi:hypothetical protein